MEHLDSDADHHRAGRTAVALLAIALVAVVILVLGVAALVVVAVKGVRS